MEAGKLRFKADIQRRSGVHLAQYGEPISTFEAFKRNVPCDIVNASTAEDPANLSRTQRDTHVIRMRHVAGIETGMRILLHAENRKFDISSIKRDRTLRRDMLIRVVEVDEERGE